MLRLLLCLSSVVGLASARVEKLETEKVQACMTSLSTMAANDRMEALGHAWNQLDGDQRAAMLKKLAAFEGAPAPSAAELARVVAHKSTLKADYQQHKTPSCSASLLIHDPVKVWQELLTEEERVTSFYEMEGWLVQDDYAKEKQKIEQAAQSFLAGEKKP